MGVVDGGEVVMVRKGGAEGLTSDQLQSAVQVALISFRIIFYQCIYLSSL